MVAFTTSFIPSTVRITSTSVCRSRLYSKPARVVHAVISQEPRKDVVERGDDEVAPPFTWVENWYPVMPECDAPVDEPFAFTLCHTHQY